MLDQTEYPIGRRYCLLKREGKVLSVLLIVLVVVGAIIGGVYWRVKQTKSAQNPDLIFVSVIRSTFVHEVNGKGSAESAKNVDVASQVEGSATVIYLIPEGSDVKKGELLVELDSSDVDEKLDSQVVTTNTSRATLNSSRATLRSAEISLEEYVEGTFEQSWKEYENTVFEQEQTRKQSADSARFTERLLNLGYSTELQYEVDKVAEEKAKNSLDVANLKKMTLLKYTSEKQITSLMSDIETARAKVDSDKNSYNINLNRENRYRQQSANCKIKAPQDGQVVYANQDSRRMSESDMIKEGSSVRQRQVLVRLPDKTQMQVKTMINESNISSVKVGMPAKITFDSLPNRVIEGEVVKVNQYPEIVWMSSAKDYVTLVKIKDDLEDLKTGLTAQVRIIADEQKDVLMLPVQCITEFGQKTYCITYKDGIWGYKEVLLGASNEKQVVVLDGLSEGDLVVSGARLYRDKVDFPDPNLPSDFENSEVYQAKIAQAKEEEKKNATIEAGLPIKGEMPLGSSEGMPMLGASERPMGGFSNAVPEGAPSGMPPMGERPGRPMGDPSAMLKVMVERYRKGEISEEMLANMPADLVTKLKEAASGGSFSLSNDEIEEQNQRKEEAKEYAKTIEEKLARDSKIAAISPFFTRTVMEMQRELLSAISKKTEDLQAHIATRQNEIIRRQEDIELLNKETSSSDADSETTIDESDVSAKITQLEHEICLLRGESETNILDNIVYLDKVEWNKYVDGNNITRDALLFLSEDSNNIFNSLFPNSQEIDTVSSVNGTSQSEKNGEEKELGTAQSDDDNSRYEVFISLFDDWDSDQNGKLTPTEFVLGFFSDRKSFQDAEPDDDIESFYAEFFPEGQTEDEISFSKIQPIVKKILTESERPVGLSKRMSRPNDSKEVNGKKEGFPPPSEGLDGGKDFPPLPRDRAFEKDSFGRPTNVDNDQDKKEKVDLEERDSGNPMTSLAEVSSLRQAVVLFVSQMDFNGDGLLQKSEFVKGYHEVKDVAGKLFLSAQIISSVDSGSGGRGFGPPPGP